MVRSMFGALRRHRDEARDLTFPCASLMYFRNRFLPTSEMSDTVAGGNNAAADGSHATFPPSTLTDTAKVIGSIPCDVMGAVQSPMNGAACAGETVDLPTLQRQQGRRAGNHHNVGTEVTPTMKARKMVRG